MSTSKSQILKDIETKLKEIKKGSFIFRVLKLIKKGEFSSELPSSELANLLNEGAGKKIKANNLTALMEPLLSDDIVEVKIIGSGRNKKKYWFPAWIEKSDVVANLASGGVELRDIFFITGKNAWSDSNDDFPQVIDRLVGDLCIVDPFYGNGTFVFLSKFGKKRKIRFLSSKLGDEEQNDLNTFQVNLKKFNSQFRNIKLKKYSRYFELHDRYIIAENALVIIGYGTKDFGSKESFVIYIPKDKVNTFLPLLKKIFEIRWKKGNNITKTSCQ